MKEEHAFTYIESYIDIFLLDENGINIFTYGHPNIEVFDSNKGKLEPLFDNKSFAPHGYHLNKEDYSVRIFLILPKNKENISYTYFRVDHGHIYALKTRYIINAGSDGQQLIGGSSIIRQEIWLDELLIWDINTFDERINIVLSNTER